MNPLGSIDSLWVLSHKGRIAAFVRSSLRLKVRRSFWDRDFSEVKFNEKCYSRSLVPFHSSITLGCNFLIAESLR